MTTETVVLNPEGIKEALSQEGMRLLLTELTDKVVATAQDLAPVATGHYRDGIHGEVTETDGQISGAVMADDFKSNWVEFGTATGFPEHATIRRAAESVGLQVTSSG